MLAVRRDAGLPAEMRKGLGYIKTDLNALDGMGGLILETLDKTSNPRRQRVQITKTQQTFA